MRDIPRLAQRVAEGKAKYEDEDVTRVLEPHEVMMLEQGSGDYDTAIERGDIEQKEYDEFIDEFGRASLVDKYHRMRAAKARLPVLEREMLETF